MISAMEPSPPRIRRLHWAVLATAGVALGFGALSLVPRFGSIFQEMFGEGEPLPAVTIWFLQHWTGLIGVLAVIWIAGMVVILRSRKPRFLALVSTGFLSLVGLVILFMTWAMMLPVSRIVTAMEAP